MTSKRQLKKMNKTREAANLAKCRGRAEEAARAARNLTWRREVEQEMSLEELCLWATSPVRLESLDEWERGVVCSAWRGASVRKRADAVTRGLSWPEDRMLDPHEDSQTWVQAHKLGGCPSTEPDATMRVFRSDYEALLYMKSVGLVRDHATVLRVLHEEGGKGIRGHRPAFSADLGVLTEEEAALCSSMIGALWSAGGRLAARQRTHHLRQIFLKQMFELVSEGAGPVVIPWGDAEAAAAQGLEIGVRFESQRPFEGVSLAYRRAGSPYAWRALPLVQFPLWTPFEFRSDSPVRTLPPETSP